MEPISYKLNIILPNDGWILEKMGNELHKYINGSNIVYSNNKAIYELGGLLDDEKTINYFINYALYKRKNRGIDVALFTHLEEDIENKNLAEYFISVAKQVDYSIFMTPKYEKLCKNICKATSVIIPGIDKKYKTKLNLGIVGRDYSHTTRKNSSLSEKLSNIEWLNIEYTNGKLSENEMPQFYNRQDYTLVLSKVEGGPMCVLESLAMGKKLIFPKDVGFGELFTEGLYLYEKDDLTSLIEILEKLFNDKKKLAKLVDKYSWENFAEEHKKIFDKLSEKFNN